MSAQIEELVQRANALADPQARETALDLAQAILDLHATALERLIELVSEAEGAAQLRDAFAADPKVGGVLLLHNLHPQDLATRVRHVLDDPAFRTRGAAVKLISAEDDVVRVHIEGGPALRTAVEKAVWEAAPDAREVLVEGGEQLVSSGFVQIESARAGCP